MINVVRWLRYNAVKGESPFGKWHIPDSDSPSYTLCGAFIRDDHEQAFMDNADCRICLYAQGNIVEKMLRRDCSIVGH